MRAFINYSAAFVLCFLIGVYGIGGAQKLWQRYFPEAHILQGDYATHYQATNSRVVVYGTQDCPYCIQARDFLRLRGIPFADARVDNDVAARARLQSLNLESVPVLLIGDQLIRGFNANAIDASLRRAGITPRK